MRVTLATSFALLAATAAANQAGHADNSISASYNGQLVEPIEPLAETADDYEVNDNQRGRSGARGRGRGRGLKFLKELAPEVIGPAIVPGIETLMGNQRGGEYEEYYEEDDNQRSRSGARGRGRGRGLKFLKELAPEVIGPAIVPGIETLMSNQRGGEYEEYYEEDDNQRSRSGARGRGRGRSLKFLKELAPEVIGPAIVPGIETLMGNQRGGEYEEYYEEDDNQRSRSGARGRGRGRSLKFLKELAPEVIGPAIVPGIETLMGNQRSANGKGKDKSKAKQPASRKVNPIYRRPPPFFPEIQPNPIPGLPWF